MPASGAEAASSPTYRVRGASEPEQTLCLSE